MTERDLSNQGVANAYVLAGHSKEDRIARLNEVPEANRKQAECHVRTVFAIRKHHAKNKK